MLKFNLKNKPIKNVLLTNATDPLGCNILYQLLNNTSYTIYLPLDKNSDKAAYKSIAEKFNSYFDVDLAKYLERVKPFAANIDREDLGVSRSRYKTLIQSIDSIIHCAIFKSSSYKDYSEFINMKKQTTINLLELTKLTELKDFHYISGLSMQYAGYISDFENYESIMNDIQNPSIENEIIYLKANSQTKLEVTKSREQGLKTNIYNVGNILFNFQDFKLTEHFEQDYFYIKNKTILNLGMMPRELVEIEISPINLTASAIVKLFDLEDFSNQTYNVFNPKKCNLFDLLTKQQDIPILITNLNEFNKTVREMLKNKNFDEQINLFTQHQQWFGEYSSHHLSKTDFVNNSTNEILSELNFKWPEITLEAFSEFIEQTFKNVDKMIEQERVFIHLNFMAQMVPAIFYWMDLDGRFVGLNQKAIKAMGVQSKEDVIGKTVYDLYPKSIADILWHDFKRVVDNRQDLQNEYILPDLTTQKNKYFSATVSPLLSNTGNLLGVIGTAIDVTTEREIDNENNYSMLQKNNYGFIENEEEFKRIVDEIVYNIQTNTIQLLKEQIEVSCTQPEQGTDTYQEHLDELNSYIYGKYGNTIDIYGNNKKM